MDKIKKKKSESDIDDTLNSNFNNIIFVEEKIANTYDIYLTDDIGKASCYSEVFTILKTVSELDTVVFHINSDGGYLDTFVQFYSFIQKCRANTIAIIYSACSAAAFIAFSCKEIELAEFSSIYIHNGSSGYQGKTDDHKEYSKNFDDQMKDIINNLLKGFLTDKEIEKVLEGKSFWFSKKEIEKRLVNMTKLKK